VIFSATSPYNIYNIHTFSDGNPSSSYPVENLNSDEAWAVEQKKKCSDKNTIKDKAEIRYCNIHNPVRNTIKTTPKREVEIVASLTTDLAQMDDPYWATHGCWYGFDLF